MVNRWLQKELRPDEPEDSAETPESGPEEGP